MSIASPPPTMRTTARQITKNKDSLVATKQDKFIPFQEVSELFVHISFHWTRSSSHRREGVPKVLATVSLETSTKNRVHYKSTAIGFALLRRLATASLLLLLQSSAQCAIWVRTQRIAMTQVVAE